MYMHRSLRATDKVFYAYTPSPSSQLHQRPRGLPVGEQAGGMKWLQRDERFGGLDTLPTLTYTKARLLVEDWSDWYTQSANQSWQPIAPNKPYDCSALWCVQDRQWMVHTDVLLWYVTMVMDGVWLKKWLVWVLVADCGGGDHVSCMMSSLEIDS